MFKKFENHLGSMSPAAKASFWFVVANLALKGISFITTPIFTRLLDVADYGVTSVFTSWEGVISVFAALPVSAGMCNVAMIKFEKDIDGFMSSILGFTAITSVFIYSGCIAFNLIFPDAFKLSNFFLVYMWLQTFTNACSSTWLIQKRFKYQYKGVILYTFVNALLSPIIAIICINIFSSNKAYAKLIGSGICAIVIGVFICIRAFFKGKRFYDKAYWKYSLKFNIPLIPHYMSSTLLVSSDKLMINSMIGEAQAGIYSIAYSITGIVNLITQSINISLVPYTLQSIKKGDFNGLKRTITLCSALVAFVCSAIMLFAREGVLVFATEKYLPAIQFVLPLSGAVLLDFVIGIVGNISYYYEKTGFMSKITVTLAIVNIILNYFGIKYFGYIAAGYATLISSILRFVMYYIGVGKFEENLSLIVDIKQLLLIFAVFAIIMVYSEIFAVNLIMRILLVVVLCITVLIFRNKIMTMFKSMKKEKTAE